MRSRPPREERLNDLRRDWERKRREAQLGQRYACVNGEFGHRPCTGTELHPKACLILSEVDSFGPKRWTAEFVHPLLQFLLASFQRLPFPLFQVRDDLKVM